MSIRSLSALFIIASSAACSMSTTDEVLDPSAVVIDQSKHALTTGTLAWARGTYSTSCKNPDTGAARTASEEWTLKISGDTTSTLKVVRNDADCVLTLNALGTASETYLADPAIAMNDAYQAKGSAFAQDGGAIEFIANAKLSVADMSENFVMSILFSDDLASADGGSKTGSWAQFEGSSSEGVVAAPQYAVTNTIAVETDVDDRVSATTGSVAFSLASGKQAGDNYRIVDGAIAGLSFATVDAAYNAAGGTAPAAIPTPFTLQSAAILANGSELTAYRTVIVQRAVDGVASYQVFTLEFLEPVRPIE
jgi:hypothetical protein